jgi:carbamoyltransferase
MIILGINAYHPDSSACLLIDGEIKIAIEEERLNRIKHWSGFPKLSIIECLKNQKIQTLDIDLIAINHNFYSNLINKIKFVMFNKPRIGFYLNRLNNHLKKQNILDTFKEEVGDLRKTCKLFEVDHHKSHVASSYYDSPFEDSVNLSVDGFGDFASLTWGQSKNNKIIIDNKILFPHSLGIFYESFTQLLGFKNFGDEYKIMGLSSYGKPSEISKVKKIINIKNNGEFCLNLNYFNHHKKNVSYSWNNCSPKSPILFNDQILKLFDENELNKGISDYHKNIAASVQSVYEEVFFNTLNHIYNRYQIKNLTLSGGCAQNSLANGKIITNSKFENIFVASNPGDAGGAIGSAYVAYENYYKKKPKRASAYLGKEYTELEISDEIKNYREVMDLKNCTTYTFKTYDDVLKFTAKQISIGKIIGWFQGKMEWGPRALGNRSILADPRNKNIREIINLKIKRRENFRPFAPSILLDYAEEWFENFYDEEPFMSRVLKFREKKRKLIPSVVHLDGTGRLQTVNKNNNPLFYKLISSFKMITGIPLILNTSFNENEPIVDTPQNAIDCFLRTEMDLLVMGKSIVYRKDQVQVN